MKIKSLALTAALAFALSPTLSAAEAPLTYEGLPGSEMTIDGTATGHGWQIKGVVIGGAFEVEPAWQKDPSLKSVTCLGEGKVPPKCEIRIPIRTLKSQVPVGRTIMDNRMIKEMKGQQFPFIDYKLAEMKLKGEVPTSGSPVTFDTKGKLAIAGKTNDVAFPITMERVGADKLKFAGTYKTKMTALGIQPPEFTVMGIGSKTGDDITLTWTWLTGIKADAAK